MYLTRNQAYGFPVPWVRIPPSPPKYRNPASRKACGVLLLGCCVSRRARSDNPMLHFDDEAERMPPLASSRATRDIEAQLRLGHTAIVARRLLHLHDRPILRRRQRHEPRIRSDHQLRRPLIARCVRGGNHALQTARNIRRGPRRRNMDHGLRRAQLRTARRTATGEGGDARKYRANQGKSMQAHSAPASLNSGH